MVAFSVIAFFGIVVFIVGIIGLIVNAIRHKGKRAWLIVLLVGLAVAIIFTVVYGVTREDETSEVIEETIVEEDVIANDVNESSQEVIEEAIEEPAVTWIVKDTGHLFDETVVAGDEKSLTIEFVYKSTPSGVYAEYQFQVVTIDGTSYRVDNDPEDVFVGLPIITKLNNSQFDFFIPTFGANPDEPVLMTYTMNDGSNLPNSIVITYNATETRTSAWSGGNTLDRYSDETLTIERS